MKRISFFLLVSAIVFAACNSNNYASASKEKATKAGAAVPDSLLKKAYVAGGCFWGMQELFRKEKGVVTTQVGYIGGDNRNPTYANHPGHAEGIEITYDPSQISYLELLDFFFRIHDPTTLNRQGNDVGTSYRSAIFYENESEKQDAEKIIKIVNDSKRWKGEVATKVTPYEKFWPAEEEHQDYLQKNPGGYTCHYERFGTFLDRK